MTSSGLGPIRKKHLVTFSVTKYQKKRITMVEKERQLTQRYLKHQLAWINEHGTEESSLDGLLGPVAALPRALMSGNDLPYKPPNKSNVTNYIGTRYSQYDVVNCNVPNGWIPDVFILEGMLMIQLQPLWTVMTVRQYSMLLLKRFILPHLQAHGVNEIHVVFDNQDAMEASPKEIEWRRDDSKRIMAHHTCGNEAETLKLWQSGLECRDCKKKLTHLIANELLQLVQPYLSSQQCFIITVGEVAFEIGHTGSTSAIPHLWSNVDKANLRMWLHCIHANGNKIQMLFPNTDLYFVGLPLAHSCMIGRQVLVQLSTCTNKSGSGENRFLSLNAFSNAINLDPDLASIPVHQRPQALQSLYACTGCEFISFFVGYGKTAFLAILFQYAEFICMNDANCQGSIADVDMVHAAPSLYSFLRLVGYAYFKKHSSAFTQQTPVALYNSINNCISTWEHHDKWLGMIRQTIWLRTETAAHNLPSTEALKLHWIRTLWVLNMWHKTTENDMELPSKSFYIRVGQRHSQTC